MCRCEKRAQDLHLPHLFVFARLALAQFALEHQSGPSNQQLAKGSQAAASQGHNFLLIQIILHLC
jgi:hypothetical protein